MITGVVNAHREATICLLLQAADGRDQEIEAILDTGFNGSLTLPPSVIAALTAVADPWPRDPCQRHRRPM